ncbi:RrF2 family transcriptional regulator [Rhodohalobacter sp. 614A]|uniref:RrF2 family transcriptional regulator n=1 Tax=Rhodohalobacter sp. 614A TaxID=2908649 RepID=UPI001F32EDBF|nr:Rrf2 family transcriptional regulator [Rhodohalobacter sp. 614A]
MLLSKSCVYGLRASLYLASRKNGEFIPIRKMSDKLEISFHFLTKILQQLTAQELLESFKGPNGGVRLKKPGTEIRLMDVVLAIDGPQLLTECALGLPGCGTKDPCPLHDKWAETRDAIREMLEDTSLKELVEKGKAENLRLTTDGGFDILFEDDE